MGAEVKSIVDSWSRNLYRDNPATWKGYRLKPNAILSFFHYMMEMDRQEAFKSWWHLSCKTY